MRIKPLLITLFFSLNYSQNAEANTTRWNSFFYLTGHITQLTGVAQTPQGGTPGTSSLNRPSFHEANIHKTRYYQAGGGIVYDNCFAALEYKQLAPHGDTILTTPLTTHKQFLPANSAFDMSVRYAWTRFTLGKHLLLFSSTDCFITPVFSLNYLQYQYVFSGTSASSRAFNLLNTSIGIKIHQPWFASAFFTDLSLEVALPVNHVRTVDSEIGFSYVFSTKTVSFIPRIGIAYSSIRYRDTQTLPNHIGYRAFPDIFLGIVVKGS